MTLYLAWTWESNSKHLKKLDHVGLFVIDLASIHAKRKWSL